MNKIDYSVYLVTDRDILQSRDLCEAVEESILGGATVVQLREKYISFEEFVKLGKKLHKITQKYNIPLIINDNVDVAIEVGAEGVHVGQGDEELSKVRAKIGDKIIGVSVENVEEALIAQEGGADYLGIGSIFYTGSKKDINIPIGLEGLKKIVESVNIPNVAIGGIHLDNVREVMKTKTDGVAVISEILGKEDIKEATAILKNYVKEGIEMNNFAKVISEIREKKPIVYQITNTVTINDCANVTLAIGASPIMSFCEDELEDVLSFASALVINIGTMDKSMRKIVVKAGKIANKLGKPVILDPVGAGATQARKELVEKLLEKVKFAVIKGNVAEIKAIYGMKNESNRGVDSVESSDNIEEIAKELAIKYNCVIAATGKVDLVTDGKRVAKIENGDIVLGSVTGTGCMTGALIGSACGATEDYFTGAITMISTMGIAGEKAKLQGNGNGNFRQIIMDTVYQMNEEEFLNSAKIRVE